MIKNKVKTKKLIYLLLLIVLFACIMICFTPTCEAEEKKKIEGLDEIKNELEDNIDGNLDNLNLKGLEDWLSNLEKDYSGIFGNGGVYSAIKGVLAGKFDGGFSVFFKILLSSISGMVLDILPILITIISIAILYSLLEGLTSGFLTKPTKEIIYFVCFSAITVIIMVKIISLINVTRETVGIMQSLMELAFPIIVTMIALLGGVTTSAVFKPMMSILATTITMIISNVVLPLIIAIIIFSIISNLTKQVKLDRMTKFFKSTTSVILGTIFSLFITFLSLQGLTGGIVDSISVKTAKFALQSYVPILGGYLSDGFDLMLASVVLIKNSFGVVVLLMMIGAILAPVFKILIFSLGLKLVSGIIEPLCDERFSKMTSSLATNISYLAVTLIGVGFMFFVVIMLAIYTCNMGVV